MDNNIMLRCSNCEKEYPFGTYTCKCNNGVLFVEIDFKQIGSINELQDVSRPGIWKFSKFLPTAKEYFSFGEGNTPCLKSRVLGPKNNTVLYFKDEGQNPTGSFKDRAAAVLVTTERELGHLYASTVSSGNASGALSLYSTIAGINLTIFMYKPPKGKFIHTSSFGHKIFLIASKSGSDVIKVAEKANKRYGWSSITTTAGANPFNIEGYKTISYEIFCDIGLPDVVITPAGSGTLSIGLWKGFYELYKMGLVPKLPHVIGVQPEKVNPIDRAYQKGNSKIEAVGQANTIATGTVVEDPGITGEVALKLIRETKGFTISVSEKNIFDTFRSLPKEEGIFSEPTGALSVAGFKIAIEKGLISKNQKVVCIISASGFKDLYAFKRHNKKENQIAKISPSIDLVEKKLKTWGKDFLTMSTND